MLPHPSSLQDNVTRFIVLARDPLLGRGGTSRSSGSAGDQQTWKTSIVFSLAEGPGQLFKSLSVFALRDIDLTKIESRPMRSQPLAVAPGEYSSSAAASETATMRRFNYLFYVDFIGTLESEACQNALRHLQEICPFMRVLGSYPADRTI